MKIGDREQRIKLSISSQGYENKNEIDWKNIQYKQMAISINDLSYIIRSGYCYTSIFKDKEFGIKQKDLNNFQAIQIITFDCDNIRNDIELNDVIGILRYKPTIAYNTKNNHIIKHGDTIAYSRFRLLYVIDEPITDINLYHALYNSIFSTIDKLIFDEHKKTDHCGRSVVQQFSGNKDCKVYQSNIIYSTNDFDYTVETSEQKAITTATIKQFDDIVINAEFMEDLTTLQPTDFISKYANQYELLNESKVIYNQDHYALLGEDYTFILRDYKLTEYRNGKGELKRVPIRKIIKDGQRRRYKMFIYCQVRKQIKPTVSIEELIYNLVYDRQYYFDNEDNQLNNATLVEIAHNAIKYDYNLKSPNKAKFKVDKAYCNANNISARTLRNKVKQIINFDKIGEVYDLKKSLKENLKYMREVLHMKVSQATLYRFCKINGINPKGEKVEKAVKTVDKTKELTIVTHSVDNVESAIYNDNNKKEIRPFIMNENIKVKKVYQKPIIEIMDYEEFQRKYHLAI